jgi:hypothetical protein
MVDSWPMDAADALKKLQIQQTNCKISSNHMHLRSHKQRTICGIYPLQILIFTQINSMLHWGYLDCRDWMDDIVAP